MNSAALKKGLIHLIPIVIFFLLSATYFFKVFDGKTLNQHDIVQYKGVAKEILDHNKKTDGDQALWTNSLFGGMPSILINSPSEGNKIKLLTTAITFDNWRPISIVFLYFLGFYILLLAFGVDWRLSAIGAVAYGLSSYFFIIIEAGHITKAYALGYMPMIIGGIYLTYKRNMLLGGILTGLGLAMQIMANHLQITYYTLLIVLFMGIALLIENIINKTYVEFAKRTAVLIVAAALAVGSNLQNILMVQEYGEYSIRGKSELTQDKAKENKTSGLDKDYALEWSYGIGETWSLLIPNIHGGGASDHYRYSSAYDETRKMLRRTQVPKRQQAEVASQIVAANAYWGNQRFTMGTVYAGAISCFLFILAFFVFNGRTKWWILGVTTLAILLAWGSNFTGLSYFFLDYVPGYNKFRAVSTILVIVQLTIPLLGMIGLHRLLFEPEKIKQYPFIDNSLSFIKNYNSKAIAWTFFITGGLTLLLALGSGFFFDFNPGRINANANMEVDQVLDMRASLLRADAFRSFIYIAMATGLLIAYVEKKFELYVSILFGVVAILDLLILGTGYRWAAYIIMLLCILIARKNENNLRAVLIFMLGLFMVFDMWGVNKRYLNDESFVSNRKAKEYFIESAADKAILADNKDQARVVNINNTFTDARTSYFHHSIGGYHGAKMRRYQELFEAHIASELYMFGKAAQSAKSDIEFMMLTDTAFSRMKALRMLNTKYFIYNQNAAPIINKYALGNAWFVEKATMVENADEEIAVLKTTDVANELITDKRFADQISSIASVDQFTGNIKRTEYSPNKLTYEYEASSERLAVFSEIYYPKGWTAYVDGVETPHFRANYVLRAMKLPAGKHTIEFKYAPKSFYTGRMIAYICSLILLLAGVAYLVYAGKKKLLAK